MLEHPHSQDLVRFFSSVEIDPAGCWIWTGLLSAKGYGVYDAEAAHRTAYRWFVGPIAATFHVHHDCGDRRCVHPVHLRALSASQHASVHRTREPARLDEMRRPPTHPGEIFEEEYRKPSGVSQAEAARRMGMSMNRLNEIVAGKRGVTAETAVLFGALTRTDARFWLHLQAERDLWEEFRKSTTYARIQAITTPS